MTNFRLNCLQANEGLKAITESLVEDYGPQKIVSFGAYLEMHHQSGIFTQKKSELSATYFLLMVLENEGYDHCIRKYATNGFQGQAAVLVHSEREILTLQSPNSKFLSTVLNNGAWLYGKSENQQRLKTSLPYFLKDTLELKKVMDTCLDMACNFRNSAEIDIVNERYGGLPFLFHQAIAYSCKAVIHTFMAYQPDTQDINLLIYLCRNCSHQAAALLQSTSPIERELIAMVSKSYVQQESIADIDAYDAHYLFNIVNNFIEFIERLCAERISQK